ncbi:MAG: hypothetical protein OES47_00965 [Acidobacteriota bacterium]|nr:hypothetical protein [Acidobacteriota bacterium]
MTRMMRTTGAAVTLAVAALVLLPACALRKGPPDPAKVQRKMNATLEGEKALIRSTVSNSENADKLIALLADRDRLVAEQAETVGAYRDRMKALNADYSANRSDFDQAVADYNGDRMRLQGELVALIDAMKKETTADEWKAVSKYQLKKLNPREMAYKEAGGGS